MSGASVMYYLVHLCLFLNGRINLSATLQVIKNRKCHTHFNYSQSKENRIWIVSLTAKHVFSRLRLWGHWSRCSGIGSGPASLCTSLQCVWSAQTFCRGNESHRLWTVRCKAVASTGAFSLTAVWGNWRVKSCWWGHLTTGEMVSFWMLWCAET